MRMILLLPAALLISIIAYGQSIQENQIVLSGKVTDVNTGQPVKCDIAIKIGEKKFKIFSDPESGKYSQLIMGGKDYTFTFYQYDIYRQVENVSFASSKKYREETKDFTVTVLKPGVTVEREAIFAKNSSDLLPAGKKMLKNFKRTMRFHRTCTWNFLVGVSDSFDNLDSPEARALADKRLETVKSELKIFKAYAEKIDVKIMPSTSDTSKNSFAIEVATIEKP